MLYYSYIAGFALAKKIPLKICYFVAESIASVYYLMSFRDKRAMRNNLRVVLGDAAGKKEIDRHILRIFKNFAKYLVDFFRLSKFSIEYVNRNIDIRGRENIDGCLRNGKGVITVTVHLGNWELGAALLGALGYNISAIVLQHPDKRIDGFFTDQRLINGIKSIPTGSRVKGCFRVLAANEILAIAADKDYTFTGVEVDFFGKKAFLPKGPAAIALKTGAPIVFTILTREPGNRFKLTFEEPIICESTGDTEKDIKRVIEQYAKHFEKYIRAYPDQWYAFRKIWDQE